jgi:hypothetical protein
VLLRYRRIILGRTRPAIRLENLVCLNDIKFVNRFIVCVCIGGASSGWELAEYIPTYTPQYNTVQKGGFVTGGAAKGIMSSSGLPTASIFLLNPIPNMTEVSKPVIHCLIYLLALRKIWELSDCDRDGQLDLNEFVLAMVLIEGAKNGEQIPAQLDPAMIPPGK